MTTGPLHVHRLGMACPVGLMAVTACAAMRAGISRRVELPYLDDDGEPIYGSWLARLPARASRHQRWSQLLAHALRDLHDDPHGLASSAPPRRLPLVVALPDAAPRTGPTREALVAEAMQSAGWTPDPKELHVVPGGSLAGVLALERARALLAAGHPAVIVCAADSWVTPGVLLELQRAHRLLGPQQADGVVPGEAAAGVVVSASGHGALGAIRGIGLAHEPASIGNDVPLRALGATEAARRALAQAGRSMHDMDLRISDAAGESYEFKEQALAVTKLLRRRKERFPLWLPAASLGHVGAAAGLCGVVWALVAMRRGHAPGLRAIAWASDGRSERGALVLEGRAQGDGAAGRAAGG